MTSHFRSLMARFWCSGLSPKSQTISPRTWLTVFGGAKVASVMSLPTFIVPIAHIVGVSVRTDAIRSMLIHCASGS